MIRKNSNNVRLAAAISLAIFSNQSLLAGDVEISLPTATDAFTVDQPAGTELMRVNGDGKVGIGTASPTSVLTVANPGGGVFTSEFQTNEASTLLNASRGYTVNLVNTDQTVNNFAGMSFNDEAGFTPSSAIIGTRFVDHTNNYGKLFFSTRGANNPMDTINMVLNEEGNVGIGTVTPNEKLEVDGKIQVTAGNDVCIAGGPCLSNASGGSSKFVDGTVATDAVYTTGNVGIGTATPAAMLDVAGTVRSTADYFSPISGLDGAAFYAKSNNPAFALMDTNATNGWYIEAWSTGALTFNTDDEVGDNRAEHIRFTKEGNVGIGTNAPSEKLEIHGATDADLDMYSYGSDSTTFHIGRAGGTKDAPTLVQQTGNALFALEGMGYDGSGYRKAGAIHFGLDGAAGANDMPGNISFHTTPDGSSIYKQRMTIKNNGYVGIGTNNPLDGLHLANEDIANYTNLDAAGAFGFHLMRSRGTDGAPTNVLAGDDLGHIQQRAYVGSDYFRTAQISFKVDGSPGANFVPSRMEFETTAATGGIKTTRLTIKNDGKVGIGTTSPSTKLHVAGTITQDSDQRLKKDIKPLENSLEKIIQLQGVSFNWKDEEKHEKGIQLGLIAQAVEKVIPDVVSTANDEQGTKSVAYTSLIAVLIEGMKEQQAEITAQQKRIEALEAKLEQ